MLDRNGTKIIFKVGGIRCLVCRSAGGEEICSTAMAPRVAYCYQGDTTNAFAEDNPVACWPIPISCCQNTMQGLHGKEISVLLYNPCRIYNKTYPDFNSRQYTSKPGIPTNPPTMWNFRPLKLTKYLSSMCSNWRVSWKVRDFIVKLFSALNFRCLDGILKN
jgi:hypothetical protein